MRSIKLRLTQGVIMAIRLHSTITISTSFLYALQYDDESGLNEEQCQQLADYELPDFNTLEEIDTLEFALCDISGLRGECSVVNVHVPHTPTLSESTLERLNKRHTITITRYDSITFRTALSHNRDDIVENGGLLTRYQLLELNDTIRLFNGLEGVTIDTVEEYSHSDLMLIGECLMGYQETLDDDSLDLEETRVILASDLIHSLTKND